MTYTARLRARLVACLGTCPTCHQALPGAPTDGQVAVVMGIHRNTLWRFLQGQTPSGETIDAIEAWIQSQPGAVGP